MKITNVKVVNLVITRAEGIARFTRERRCIGPMEPYEEYAENKDMWQGTKDFIVPMVVISTDEGVEGYGFCGGGTAAVKVIIDNQYKNYLMGADPFDTEALWDQMFRGSVNFGRKGGAIDAISGVDVALWDIKGKALGVPVYKLLGGKTKNKVKMYASNLHPSDLHNPDYDLLAREAEDYVKQGYTAMKQRACAGPREGRKGMKRNELLVRTVREAIGDDFDIMIDAYMGWADVNYAIEMINRLEKYSLTWVEEPLMPDDLEGYACLRSKVRTPIAAGEHEFTRFGAKELIKNRLVDIIQLDVRRAGGITETKKIAGMAEAFGMPYIPHLAYPETLHLVVSCPMSKWAEDISAIPSWEEAQGGFTDAYILGAPKVKNGYIELDENKSGFGIKLNTEVIDELKA